MKKTYLTIFVFIFSLFLASQITFVLAISPGVTAGDEFTYDIRVYFSSTNQSTPISHEALAINSTEFFKVRITEVEGVTVSMQTIWRFINGTEIDGQNHIDLETGTKSGDFWTIIGSNLNAGDRIRPKGFDRTIINYTITKNYGPGVNRETNVIDNTFTLYNENDPNITSTEYSKIYFDRQTGMLAEINDMRVLSEPLTTETLSWKLKENHVWKEPEVPLIIILLILFIISLIIGLIVYIKRERKSQKKVS